SKSILQLIPCAAFGWKPPLKNLELEHEEVKVYSNSEILSVPEGIASDSGRNELVQLYPNAIAVEMDGDEPDDEKPDSPTEKVTLILESLARGVVGKYETRKIKYRGRVISCYFRCRFHALEDLFVYDGIDKDNESGMEVESYHDNTRAGTVPTPAEKPLDQCLKAMKCNYGLERN
ncbi:hypothetical protein P5673_006987, partial [Acropora cervicornis]